MQDDGDKNDGDYSPKKGTPSKKKPLWLNEVVRRRMTVIAMKTGREPKKEQKKLGYKFHKLTKKSLVFNFLLNILIYSKSKNFKSNSKLTLLVSNNCFT